jgi:hypothetical protein
VFYEGDRVLGGAAIERALPARAADAAGSAVGVARAAGSAPAPVTR